MGRYPVVPDMPFYRAVYEDLPVVFVDTCYDITEDFLMDKIEEFKDTAFNYDKLWHGYWQEKILTW
jgi:hypothetical protein